MLVELMKRATQNKQYAELDHAIKTKVEGFLYNKGRGRYIPIADLVLLRNKERARHKLVSIKNCYKVINNCLAIETVTSTESDGKPRRI